jgi:hypothetical protein
VEHTVLRLARGEHARTAARHHVVSCPTCPGTPAFWAFVLSFGLGVRRAAGMQATKRSKKGGKQWKRQPAALHGGCVRRGGVVRRSTMP